MESPILASIIQESVLLLLIIGSIVALLLGLLLILSPQQANALSQRYNHWVSLRRPTKSLEIPHESDHYLYRHHRVMGLFILISSSYILYQFAFNYDQTMIVHALSNHFGNTTIVEWLLEATLWFILPISGVLILFGAMMALKPSAIKNIEMHSNRWISTRKITQPLEKQNKSLDRWVEHQPRRFGLILTLAASYNLTILVMFYINNLK